MAKSTNIDKLISGVRERHGDSSIMMASDMPERPPISSGSLALDFAIGIGGLPGDRLVEIAGAESAGKTTLGILAMSNALDAQPDRNALILDTEHKLSAQWVEKLIGTDRMKRVALAWPDDAEQAVSIYSEVVRSGLVSFVLFDSIAASQTRRSSEDPEKPEYGGNALIITRFARLASTFSQKYHVLTVAINQIRADMDGYRRLITSGGHGLKHACVLRIQLKKGRDTVEETIDGEKFAIGHTVYAKVVKNQLAPPGRTAMYWFFNVPTEQYGFGVDTLDEVFRLGVLTGVIRTRAGHYYHDALPGGHVHGMKKLRERLSSDKALHDSLVSEILARLAEYGADVAPMTDPDDPIDDSGVGALFLQGGEEVEEAQ